jgi:hypothetical protein
VTIVGGHEGYMYCRIDTGISSATKDAISKSLQQTALPCLEHIE